MNKLYNLLSRLNQWFRITSKNRSAVTARSARQLSGSIGYVNQEFDFGFKFLPKSASTSVLGALFFINHDRVFKFKHHGYGVHKWGRVNSGNLSTVNNRLIVIRDPVKRFLSGYSNRVRFHGALSKENVGAISGCGIKIFNPTLSEFINDFSVYMEVTTIGHHFRPIADHLAGVPLTFFSHVVKIEDADSIRDLLLKTFAKEFVFTREQTGGKKISIGSLTYEELTKITDFYSADYRLLQGYYSKKDIFTEWENSHEHSKVAG